MDEPELRTCGRCQADKPPDRFDARSRGSDRLQSYCRDCAKAAWREWYRDVENQRRHRSQVAARRRARIERHRALLRQAKDVPCADCGRRYAPEAMDFDHRPGEQKLGEVSRLAYTHGTAKLVAEMSKCDVVCASCHRVRTARRRSAGSP